MLARSMKSATSPAKWESASEGLRLGAVHTRGETQALAVTTLGTKEDKQRLDLLFEEESFKRFMLHYNFPPFSVGEVKFPRRPGRRELGHPAARCRSALLNLLPPETDFPYAMLARIRHHGIERIVFDGHGGCGGSLSVMDAGVPIPTWACAGIAMGLVIEGEKHAILTDIAGAEDHYGDMDFKVARAPELPRCRWTLKPAASASGSARKALEQGARRARLHILDIMDQTDFIGPAQNVDLRSGGCINCRFPRTKFAT